MAERFIAGIVGLLLLSATAHATIVHGGGYGSPQSYIVIMVAAGVAAGAYISPSALTAGRWKLVVGIALAVLCGEVFGFLSTAERIIATRDAAQAPLVEAAQKHASAKAALEAEQKRPLLTADKSRLEAAEARQRAAEGDVRAKAALRECHENCRLLLTAAVADATKEVAMARGEIERFEKSQKQDAAVRIEAAQTALLTAPRPASSSALADRLKIPAWLLDMIFAAVGSIAANGMAAFLLVFAAKNTPSPDGVDRRAVSDTDGTVVPTLMVEVAPAIDRPARKLSARAAPKAAPRQLPPPAQAQSGAVKAFVAAALFPSTDGTVRVKEAHKAYVAWCEQAGVGVVDPGSFLEQFDGILRRFKIPVERDADGQFVIRGVALTAPAATQAA